MRFLVHAYLKQEYWFDPNRFSYGLNRLGSLWKDGLLLCNGSSTVHLLSYSGTAEDLYKYLSETNPQLNYLVTTVQDAIFTTDMTGMAKFFADEAPNGT